MRYVTSYATGERKRKRNGINEDSVAVTVYEDGHRSGYDPDRTGVPNNSTSKANSFTDPEANEQNDSGRSVFNLDGNDDSEQGTEVASLPQNRTAGIFVLADGAGGEDAGDLASYLATTTIPGELLGIVQNVLRQQVDGFGIDIDQDALQDSASDDGIEQAIVEAVNNASQEIVRYANETGSEGTYTTIVVDVKINDKLHYGWVGDSRMYVINQAHNNIALLTKDHTKVQRLKDKEKIDDIEAHIHPEGNRINRAVGGGSGHDIIDHSVRVDTETVKLYSDDTVLLTSDGLIDAQTDAEELYYKYKSVGRDSSKAQEIINKVVTDDDIRRIITEKRGIRSAARRFIDFSNEKGGKDNLSMILVQDEFLPSSPPIDGGFPDREYDSDTELVDRETVIDS